MVVAESVRGVIRVLPRELAERVAAGEVVDRPAAAVKELVENALDAGARWIEIELRRGGLDLIRVVDDGDGIPAASMPLLFSRHATSKLAGPDGLSRIDTLGFRGEALASLAAVADVTLYSRAAAEELGSRATVSAGGPLRRTRWARDRGTTVEVRHLFQPTPARLRFLREPRAESADVSDTVRRLAAAWPACAFSLTFDGRRSLRTTGSGDYRQTVTELLGEAVGSTLHAVARRGTGSVVLDGLLAPAHVHRPDRRHLWLVVNGRPVHNPASFEAAEAHYRPLLPRGRHPVGLLLVQAPPEAVDVNVHPAKAEVRLRDEAEVALALARLVADALAPARPAEPGAPSHQLSGLQYPLPEARRPGRRLAERGDSRPTCPSVAPTWPAAGEAAGLSGSAMLGLRLLAQVRASLLLAEDDSGLYLIDQHRAHERVIYERLRAEFAGPAPPGQSLLEPAVIEVKPHQAEALAGRLAELAALGFAWERFGGRTFLVRALPRVAGWQMQPADLAPLLGELAAPFDDWRDRLLVAVACRAAVRKGRALTRGAQAELLRELAACSTPASCPHGSPIVLALDHRQIERHFGW